jgi:hypothetical protein
MMVHRDHDMQKLERALTEVYRARTKHSPDRVDVTQSVMRAIRQSAGESSRRMTPSLLLDQFVWRTATIAAAVVLVATVLTVGLFQTGGGENSGLLAEEFESAPWFGE